MQNGQRVLLVEDSAPLAALYKQYLKDFPVTLEHVENGRDAISSIKANTPHVILLDLKLPDMHGEEILQWLRSESIPSSVIITTSHGSVDVAVGLMQNGADDFLEKPVSASRLQASLKNHLDRTRLKNLVDDYQTTFERVTYQGFIGSSLPMQAVYRIIDAAAPSTATVFISGESGTGKEVCAEAIHRQSPRKDMPFIAINCGAIPKDLMESEIFGHVKGAFTGAVSERKGAALLADKGTLFLDEICEMDLELQKKLLRFIQTGRFQRVGASSEDKVDIRFVCATNRDPLEEVQAGRFREDLYYRLHVVPINLPPLRERGNDIIDIAHKFLTKYSSEEGKSFSEFDPSVEVILRHYGWPGNVRQLQNVIRNIVVLHNDDSVKRQHLPPPLDTALGDAEISQLVTKPNSEEDSADNIPKTIRPMAEIEREKMEEAIAFCDGNVLKAAVLLEVSPSTLYRKKQSWESGEQV
ncbi:sigma-54 dependent transcriptional regulator [Parasalinivibrio latis]|uniref:sigma-54-dependent transcriptional regulator n=1 Tax=Parasalinivibrio latis TaxID=2952610 RepID=UPI0030E1F5B1